MFTRKPLGLIVTCALTALTATSSAWAETAPAESVTAAATLPDGLTITGYTEMHFGYDFGDPSIGASNERIIVQRGYDNRHNTFQVDNVLLDTTYQRGPIQTKLALQFGSTPASYYALDRVGAGTTAVSGTGPELFKYIQQALITARLNESGTVTAQAGLFVTPVGPEVLAVKDNWNWSRSNVFYGLPCYHVGAKLNWIPADKWTLTALVMNGWNNAIDINGGKTLGVQAAYAGEVVTGSVLFFTGQERGDNVAEGKPWRHMLDAWMQVAVHERLSLMAHVNAGLEDHNIGKQTWLAAALYARLKMAERWFLAVRGDVFTEQVPTNAAGVTATANYYPASRMQSVTGTVEWKATDFISLRAEVRNDGANGDIFVKGHVDTIPGGIDPVGNTANRTTGLLGVTAWF